MGKGLIGKGKASEFLTSPKLIGLTRSLSLSLSLSFESVICAKTEKRRRNQTQLRLSKSIKNGAYVRYAFNDQRQEEKEAEEGRFSFYSC